MGYRRDPLCRWCWRRGHTKRTCPETPEYIKKEYRESAKNRMCSHCNKNGYENPFGHNKLGCVRRKEDRAAFANDIVTYRRLLVEHIKSTGIGVGTLIAFPVSKWSRYGEFENVDTDIVFVKSIEPVRSISAPYFICQSTISGNELMKKVWVPGMREEIVFGSSLSRVGEIKVILSPSRYAYGDDGATSILSDSIEGTTLFEDEEGFINGPFEYPQNME